MKAAVFSKPGLGNLRVTDVPVPNVGESDVLIKVVMAGVNPIDYSVASGGRNVRPMPHIPGTEFAGIVSEIGSAVENVKPDDRVIVYPRLFDEACDLCMEGKEMLCRNGGIVGVVSNGGFAEYVSVPSRNIFRISDDINWELAASIPVAALTPYHALKEASLKKEDSVVIVGASGNTGIFAVQFAKEMGAKVIAVTRKRWVNDLGADLVVDMEHAQEGVRRISQGRMADVVMDSLGTQTFGKSLDLVGVGGKIVAFGSLTGEATIPFSSVQSRHISLLGTTGGTRKEMQEIIENYKQLKVKVWKRYKLDSVRIAIESLFSKEREGRILLEV